MSSSASASPASSTVDESRLKNRHFFTVDVEEYFQVSAFEGVAPRDEWAQFPRRLDVSVRVLLDELGACDTTGTFFVLGWVARHRPDVVREIAERGHEIASHGFWHRRLTTMTPDEFRRDLRSSKHALEDLTGAPILGFRAPSFSLVPGGEWAFDVLLEEGFVYDSSIFPIRRAGYGYPRTPRSPHLIQCSGGLLREFPLATAMLAGVRIPAAGGGYLRQFPFWLIRRAFAQAEALSSPGTFYVHPWEIDPDQPRLPVGPITRLRHYRGLNGALARIRRLLQAFRFTSIASFLEHSPDLDVSRAYRST